MTRIIRISEFNGVGLDTDNIKLIEAEDTGSVVHSRIITLRNGLKFDIDGTARADRTPGQVYATFECVGAVKGSWSADYQVQILTALEGYRGTLRGVHVDNTVTLHVSACTARCVQARPRPVTASTGTPWTYKNRVQILVDMVFEKITDWVQE